MRPEPPVLILPGYGGSGPLHWQSEWERLQTRRFRRVEQRDWDRPELDEWCVGLENAVSAAGPQVVLAAHSVACLLVAHWAARTRASITAALLVAPPDPARAGFPPTLNSFGPAPQARLPFRCLVVGSTDDPYAAPEFAAHCAAAWGGEFVSVGAAGHINAASCLGAWPVGLALLRRVSA